MSPTQDTSTLRLAIPKGRMQDNVLALLAQAGVRVTMTSRDYRPIVSLEGVQAKVLKPQSVVEMLHAGARDLGFAGADWVAELGVDVVEILDTGLDRVRLVAAAPATVLVDGELPPTVAGRPLVVASEYTRLTKRWIESRDIEARFLRSYGATEVYPPDDADCIVDNTATGATLVANGLVILDELMISSTRLYASRDAMDDPARRARIEDLATLLRSVLEARRRVMLEVNVDAARLEAVVAALPCMREPTISTLHASAGFAVKAAVPRENLPRIILELRARGGTDIVVTPPSQIVL
ncbi:MAG: ATP phosphoribosyltransferase [Phycisphaeraceae bacterium]|nr:ATP phosphoribosyltransferase [Phycisphaeraceae bacterium]